MDEIYQILDSVPDEGHAAQVSGATPGLSPQMKPKATMTAYGPAVGC
jgi:hypothetical protein